MSGILAKTLCVTHGPSHKLVCAHAAVANTFFSRLIGLLGKKTLPPGSGLWLCPSSGVHTFGMKFPIDVVALDKDLRVAGLHRGLRPWKAAVFGRGVYSILELPSGQIDRASLAVGVRLHFAPSSG